MKRSLICIAAILGGGMQCFAQTCNPNWWYWDLQYYLMNSVRWDGWQVWTEDERNLVLSGQSLMGITKPYFPRRRTWDEEYTLLAWMEAVTYPPFVTRQDTTNALHSTVDQALVCCRFREWTGDAAWLLLQCGRTVQTGGLELLIAPDCTSVLDDSLNYIRELLSPAQIEAMSRRVPIKRLPHPPTNSEIREFIAHLAELQLPEFSYIFLDAPRSPASKAYGVIQSGVCKEAWRSLTKEEPLPVREYWDE